MWRDWTLRDALLFLIGVLGVIHETVLTSLERPYLLALFAGCLGLPPFLHWDQIAASKKKRSRSRSRSKRPGPDKNVR